MKLSHQSEKSYKRVFSLAIQTPVVNCPNLQAVYKKAAPLNQLVPNLYRITTLEVLYWLMDPILSNKLVLINSFPLLLYF